MTITYSITLIGVKEQLISHFATVKIPTGDKRYVYVYVYDYPVINNF